MGLDNYPKPDLCKVLEQAGKLRIFKDSRGDVDCTATNCPFMKTFSFTLSCWIRGKIFNEYVAESSGESLYYDKTRDELENILDSLRKHYKIYNQEVMISNKKEYSKVLQLQKYLETLLSIKEWNGKLIAWF